MDTDNQPAAPTDTVSTGVEETASIETSPETSPETPPQNVATPLPGVIALIKMGFGIYRERWGALVGIGVLQMTAWFVFIIPFALTFLWGGISMATIVIATFISTAVSIGIYLWFMLASMEIIRGHTQRVSLQQALSRTPSEILPFIGMIFIAFLIFIGTGALFSLLSFSILATVGSLSGIPLLTTLGSAAAAISWLIVGILFSIWFLFSYWVFIEEEKRGIDALVASRELIRKDVGAIFWRLFATAFLVYLVYYIISVLNAVIFSGVLNGSINILLHLSVPLLLAPIMLSIVYELYRSVKARVGNEVQENKKLHKYFMGYALLGVIGIFLMIVGMLFVGGSVMHTFMHI